MTTREEVSVQDDDA